MHHFQSSFCYFTLLICTLITFFFILIGNTPFRTIACTWQKTQPLQVIAFCRNLIFLFDNFCLHSLRISTNSMNSRCLHSFPSVLLFQFVSLLVLPPDEILEQGRNASRWLIPFLDLVSFLLCLRCFVFSAALPNFSTGPSSWSSRMAMPLPVLFLTLNVPCLLLFVVFVLSQYTYTDISISKHNNFQTADS